MRRIFAGMLLLGSTVIIGFGQSRSGSDQKQLDDARNAAIEEIRLAKQMRRQGSPEAPTPADFNDTDSFGKNVMFLGSLYAGTVYIAPSCAAPDVPPLAPDDKCVAKALNQNISATDFFDSAWEITIPGKSAKNVIYLMLNNTVQHDNGFASGNFLGGQGFISYSPRVTIVSDALNDPAAIDPVTGSPMNGSFTTGLPGAKFRTHQYAAGLFEQEIDSYASVNGRGLSRVYFRAIGLPENVIDKLFKKDMTLKFGMRIAQIGSVASGTYSYTFRVLGQ